MLLKKRPVQGAEKSQGLRVLALRAFGPGAQGFRVGFKVCGGLLIQAEY